MAFFSPPVKTIKIKMNLILVVVYLLGPKQKAQTWASVRPMKTKLATVGGLRTEESESCRWRRRSSKLRRQWRAWPAFLLLLHYHVGSLFFFFTLSPDSPFSKRNIFLLLLLLHFHFLIGKGFFFLLRSDAPPPTQLKTRIRNLKRRRLRHLRRHHRRRCLLRETGRIGCARGSEESGFWRRHIWHTSSSPIRPPFALSVAELAAMFSTAITPSFSVILFRLPIFFFRVQFRCLVSDEKIENWDWKLKLEWLIWFDSCMSYGKEMLSWM